MTKKSNDPSDKLYRLSELLIEDLLATSDDDILAEDNSNGQGMRPSDMAKFAYQKALQHVGRLRLQAARDAFDQTQKSSNSAALKFDIERARQTLKNLAANDADFQGRITLAARNLTDISDSEVISIINDLIKLGAISGDDLII